MEWIRQHSCCRERGLVAFTGLSGLNPRKADKCQVFLKNIRRYISLLFVPLFSSTLCFHRLISPWCLSFLHNVSASRVSSTVWSSPLHVCLHAFFFISLLILSSRPYFSDTLPLSFLIIINISLSLSEFRGGWKSLSSELSGSAKGHSPNHPGWLWTEPAVISSTLSGREPKKDDKNIVFAPDQMVRPLGMLMNRQDVKKTTP